MYPCDKLIHISKIVEKWFTNFHGDYFFQENYVIQKVITFVKRNTEYNLFTIYVIFCRA